MKPDVIELNGVKYAPLEQLDSKIKIVVLQRGWVYVGRYSCDGEECELDDAMCIRTWGTTKGLGELADGPLKNTKLDFAGKVRFHRISEILTIECDEEKWQPHLK